MDITDIPFEKKLAAALEAGAQEKYEVLKEIGDSMKDEDEKMVFFELMNLIAPTYQKLTK